jgi:hypothetical protein
MKLTSALVVTILAFTATAMADPNPNPVADAMALPEPEAKLKGLTSCGFRGSTCGKKRDAEAKWKMTSCGFPGSTCGKKRDAEAIAERDAEAKWKMTSCGFPGSTCGKKRDEEAIAARDAEADLEEYHESLVKREAEAEPKSKVYKVKKGPKYWYVKHPKGFKGLTSCGFPGSTCARHVEEAAAAGDLDVEDE